MTLAALSAAFLGLESSDPDVVGLLATEHAFPTGSAASAEFVPTAEAVAERS